MQYHVSSSSSYTFNTHPSINYMGLIYCLPKPYKLVKQSAHKIWSYPMVNNIPRSLDQIMTSRTQWNVMPNQQCSTWTLFWSPRTQYCCSNHIYPSNPSGLLSPWAASKAWLSSYSVPILRFWVTSSIESQYPTSQHQHFEIIYPSSNRGATWTVQIRKQLIHVSSCTLFETLSRYGRTWKNY